MCTLITTTSVSTVLSRIFSDHVELHARHVQTSASSCVQPISSSISHGVDDNTFSPCVVITRPGNTSCTICLLIDRRARTCYNIYTKTPANYLEHYFSLRLASVYLYPFFCQIPAFRLPFQLYQLEPQTLLMVRDLNHLATELNTGVYHDS